MTKAVIVLEGDDINSLRRIADLVENKIENSSYLEDVEMFYMEEKEHDTN